MNMTILTKKHQYFYAYSESVRFSKLDARASTTWIPKKMIFLTDDHLEKINSVATNICNLQRAVWNILTANPKLKHSLLIFCDFNDM